MSESENVSGRADNFQFCPWEHFDADWYSYTYLRGLSPDERIDSYQHYLTIGLAKLHSPNPYFNEKWYRTVYSDVDDAVRQGIFPSGFAHYCAIGYISRDAHWLFSEGIYRARRTDLSPEVIVGFGLRNGYHHFLIAGQNEGSSGSSFYDPEMLKAATGITDLPFTSVLTAPWLGSIRLSAYFDPDWYTAMYEQVDDLVTDGEYSSPLHHYLTNPTPMLFAGSADFDEAFYAERYADIGAAVEAGIIRTGYRHFIDHGRFEDRQPSPWFDPAVYRRHKRVQAALAADPSLTAFDHYLREGRRLGLAATEPAYLRPAPARPGQEDAGKDIFVRMAHLWSSVGQADASGVGRMPGIVFQQPKKPDISVVMCAFNHFDLTIQTLLHLSGSTGCTFEVILIDNASIDDTRHIEAHVAGLRLIRNTQNLGFLKASNQGIAAARGRYVLLLNNDVILPPNALRRALHRMENDATVGAVGGRVVRTHGQLQEAGCVLFSDGSALGYGRDADPFDPEYDFVRDVDYVSGVFIMLSRLVLTDMGGLDLDFAPAYYEETDLCIRIWKRGLRVVYDPSVIIIHLEFGSSRNPDAPRALMRRNREVLLGKHRDWLADKLAPDARRAIEGRSATRQTRVLFIEDTIPYRHIGSGFVRAADVVESLVRLGCAVTVYPMNPIEMFPANRREGFHESVELLWNHDITHVPAFFAERATYYDVVWVCRAHNMHRLAGTVGQNWGPLGHAHVVLDTEALACNREAALAALQGRPYDLPRALKRELRQSYVVKDICTVNRLEQTQLLASGLPRVHVLGHAVEPRPTPNPFAARRDILALGSLYARDTPNFDGLRWFLDQVWPIVHEALPDVRLLIAGFVKDGLDVASLLAGPGVEHLGFVADAAALYNQARVFLAPTRFAAGIPFKVHEAASFGVPVMATSMLAEQLGWVAGEDIGAFSPSDPTGFAAGLIALYSNEALWDRHRQNALERIRTDCSRAAFDEQIRLLVKKNTIV